MSSEVITVSFTVGSANIGVSRFPAMCRIEYPLVPPAPAGYEVDTSVFSVPRIHFDLPPDTRDIFGIIVQDKRTPVDPSGPITLVSDGPDTRLMLVVGQAADNSYLEEYVTLNGTTPVTTVQSFNWILWVDSSFGTILNEFPSPPPDGATDTFVLSRPLIPGTLTVYLDGTQQTLGVDYAVVAGNIVFVNPPPNGSQIKASYLYELVTDRNVSVMNGFATLGILAAGALQWLSNPILYRYEDLSFGSSQSDPALTFAYQNTGQVTQKIFYVYFYNILDELSLPLIVGAAFSAPNIECLDVRNFGAVGDGITDDTASVQAALDQAHTNWLALQALYAGGFMGSPPADIGPTKVCIPSGVYCLCFRPWNDTYMLNGVNIGDWALRMKSGVTLLIDGGVLLAPQPGSTWATSSMAIATAGEHDIAIIGGGFIDAQGQSGHVSGEGLVHLEGWNLSIDGTLDLRNTNASSDAHFATLGGLGAAVVIRLTFDNLASFIRGAILDAGTVMDTPDSFTGNPQASGFMAGVIVESLATHVGSPGNAASSLEYASGMKILSVTMNGVGTGIDTTCSGLEIGGCQIVDAYYGILPRSGLDISIHDNQVVASLQNSPWDMAGPLGTPVGISIGGVDSPAIAILENVEVSGNTVRGMSGRGMDVFAWSGLLGSHRDLVNDAGQGLFMANVRVHGNSVSRCTALGLFVNSRVRPPFDGNFSSYNAVDVYDNVTYGNGLGVNPGDSPFYHSGTEWPDSVDVKVAFAGDSVTPETSPFYPDDIGFDESTSPLPTPYPKPDYPQAIGIAFKQSSVSNANMINGVTQPNRRVISQIPAPAAVDGATTVFTLAFVPSPPSSLVLTGTFDQPGVLTSPPVPGFTATKTFVNGSDYTIVGATITFAVAPPAAMRLLASFNVGGV